MGVQIELLREHDDFRAEVRAFADAKVAPRATEIDRNERIPAELIDELRRGGYLGSRVSSEHGGRGLDFVRYGLLHHELAHACASTRSLLTVHDMVAQSVARLGSQDLRGEWLPQLATGSAIAAFALTEPAVGSDASGVRTRAVDDGDHYVLSEEKR